MQPRVKGLRELWIGRIVGECYLKTREARLEIFLTCNEAMARQDKGEGERYRLKLGHG